MGVQEVKSHLVLTVPDEPVLPLAHNGLAVDEVKATKGRLGYLAEGAGNLVGGNQLKRRQNHFKPVVLDFKGIQARVDVHVLLPAV